MKRTTMYWLIGIAGVVALYYYTRPSVPVTTVLANPNIPNTTNVPDTLTPIGATATVPATVDPTGGVVFNTGSPYSTLV